MVFYPEVTNDVDFVERVENMDDFFLYKNKKTNTPAGYYREVVCLEKCSKGQLYDAITESCLDCPDDGCLRCGIPFTHNLLMWIGKDETETCALCDLNSVKYGPNVSIESIFP
jgi:hypothetical protein